MRIILLVVAAVIAVVAGVTALKLTGNNNQQNTPQIATNEQPSGDVKTVNVLVAREQIQIGTVIKPEMISRQPWPSHLVLNSFIVSDGKDTGVIGRVARTTFMPYEPLLKSRLGNPNDPSFLAATLPEGMRAITLATDVISGVAGYVFPGDRVDVLVTHNVPAVAEAEAGSGNSRRAGSGRPAYAEVLVPDARVLAVNLRRIEDPEGTAAASTAPNSITLEVPAEVAQEVRLSEKLGTLSLSLRSLKDMDKEGVPTPTTYDDLTNAGLVSNGGRVNVVRGVTKDKDYQDNRVQFEEAVETMLNGTNRNEETGGSSDNDGVFALGASENE